MSSHIWLNNTRMLYLMYSATGELILLHHRFLYLGLKQSPLKFQLHLSRTLIDAGYRQSINDEYLFIKGLQRQDLAAFQSIQVLFNKMWDKILIYF